MRLPRPIFLSAAEWRRDWFTGKPRLAEQVVSSLSINLLSLGLPVMTLQIYDRILVHPETGTLPMLIAGVSCVVLLEMGMRIARAYITGTSGAAYEHHETCEALQRVIETNPLQSRHRSAGSYINDLAAISRLKDFSDGQSASTMIDIPFVIVFLAIIAYLAGILVLVPVLLLAAFTAIAWAMGKSLKLSLEKRDRSDEARYQLLIDTLVGIHQIKGQAHEKSFIRRYESQQEEANPLNYHVGQAGGMTANVGAVFSQLMIVTVVAAGAPLVIDHSMTTGALIACVLLSGRIMQPVQRALALWTRYQDFKIAQQRHNDILSVEPPAVDHVADVAHCHGLLECRGAGFAYPDSATLLHDIDLIVRPGECVALTGDPGSGKSTLLRLLGGLYDPQAGSILVDGHHVARYSANAVRRHAGYLPAQGATYRGTVLENLTGFREDLRATAYEIAGYLGLDEVIAKLPMGYETLLEGAAADALPPGVRQRLAIGRVLIHKPRLILFDDADRALDRKGYNHVYRLLGQLRDKVAMVIVSEDRNLLSLAHRTFRLEGGTLVRELPATQRIPA